MNKQHFKKLADKCPICDEEEVCLFDVHRINEGEEYSRGNCVAICVKCHRLHHVGKLKIIEKRFSTAGYVLIYEKNGDEFIKQL